MSVFDLPPLNFSSRPVCSDARARDQPGLITSTGLVLVLVFVVPGAVFTALSKTKQPTKPNLCLPDALICRREHLADIIDVLTVFRYVSLRFVPSRLVTETSCRRTLR